MLALCFHSKSLGPFVRAQNQAKEVLVSQEGRLATQALVGLRLEVEESGPILYGQGLDFHLLCCEAVALAGRSRRPQGVCGLRRQESEAWRESLLQAVGKTSQQLLRRSAELTPLEAAIRQWNHGSPGFGQLALQGGRHGLCCIADLAGAAGPSRQKLSSPCELLPGHAKHHRQNLDVSITGFCLLDQGKYLTSSLLVTHCCPVHAQIDGLQLLCFQNFGDVLVNLDQGPGNELRGSFP